MAEHLNQKVEPGLGFFEKMGKPIPFHAKEIGYQDCKKMGLNKDDSYSCVSAMAEQLERDKPYEAQAAGMRYLDLTGTYRLMAVLLANS